MLEWLTNLFAAVCGQNPEHTWAPGGVMLPCCQRCTGLYFGAGLALFLHLLLRPRLSARFLYLHGAFLLLMAPFGFHWLPQGPLLRTGSGFLFGAGIVTFLWLPVCGERHPVIETSGRAYFAMLLAGCIVLAPAAQFGGAVSASLIVAVVILGALALASLMLADLARVLAVPTRAVLTSTLLKQGANEKNAVRGHARYEIFGPPPKS